MVDKFDIFFYTAGVRVYGKLVLRIMAMEVESKLKDEVEKSKVTSVFNESKLIAREDIGKYETQFKQIEKECSNVEMKK